MPPDQAEVADDFQWSLGGKYIVYRTRLGDSSAAVDDLLLSLPAGGGSRTLIEDPITVVEFQVE